MAALLGAVVSKVHMLSTSDHASVVSLNLFVALLCACIIIGQLLEENRWMNESITALLIVSVWTPDSSWVLYYFCIINGSPLIKKVALRNPLPFLFSVMFDLSRIVIYNLTVGYIFHIRRVCALVSSFC